MSSARLSSDDQAPGASAKTPSEELSLSRRSGYASEGHPSDDDQGATLPSRQTYTTPINSTYPQEHTMSRFCLAIFIPPMIQNHDADTSVRVGWKQPRTCVLVKITENTSRGSRASSCRMHSTSSFGLAVLRNNRTLVTCHFMKHSSFRLLPNEDHIQ